MAQRNSVGRKKKTIHLKALEQSRGGGVFVHFMDRKSHKKFCIPQKGRGRSRGGESLLGINCREIAKCGEYSTKDLSGSSKPKNGFESGATQRWIDRRGQVLWSGDALTHHQKKEEGKS